MQESESTPKVRDQTIIMRVEAETKRRIEEAARAHGLTLTTFVTRAATAAALAGQAPPEYEAGQAFVAPAAFMQSCREARRGGALGYHRAGVVLACGALSAVKREHAGWNRDLKKLRKAFVAGEGPAVLDWFDIHYSHEMREIPQRRRDQFLSGVFFAFKAGPWG